MRRSVTSLRHAWVLLHRYSGLLCAVFLAIAGLTGSIIAFAPELDAWLNPELFRSTAQGDPLSPSELAARIERADQRVRVVGIPLDVQPGRSAVLFIAARLDAATGRPFPLGANQLFADPVSGDILGMRLRGGCCLDRVQLIPFLRVVHYSLFAGVWGQAFMGAVALIWAINCLVGLYLTLPRGTRFMAQWSQAWLIKRGAGAFRLNLDLHRAGSLWTFAVLLALAVSSVALNLGDEIFRPAVGLFSELSPSLTEQGRSRLRKTPIAPALTFEDAIAAGRREAQRRADGLEPINVFYVVPYGTYAVRLGRPEAPDAAGLGPTTLFVDDQNGQIVGSFDPRHGSAGDILIQLQLPLHTGRIAGMTGRIIVAIAGLVVTMLSVTGVVMWWKRQRSRGTATAKRARSGRLTRSAAAEASSDTA